MIAKKKQRQKLTESEKPTGQVTQLEKPTEQIVLLGGTYDEILELAKKVARKSVQVYVVNLCEACRIEHPNYTAIQIRHKVFTDLKDVWAQKTIASNWPPWLKNKGRSEYFKKLNELAKERKEIENAYARLSVAEQEQRYEEDEIEGLGRPMSLYAKMNMSIDGVWKAFTNGQKDRPPHSREDLINDYIKPTREIRRKIISELIETQLLISHNDLVATDELIRDTIAIYYEAIKKQKIG
jgi:hypothetical protein